MSHHRRNLHLLYLNPVLVFTGYGTHSLTDVAGNCKWSDKSFYTRPISNV